LHGRPQRGKIFLDPTVLGSLSTDPSRKEHVVEDRESTPAEGETQSDEVEGHSMNAEERGAFSNEEREAVNADEVEGHMLNVEDREAFSSEDREAFTQE
jgi:hypothetical protein